MIRFENADVIRIGDFYRNYGYPFIDTNTGGPLQGALEPLDQTMKIAGPNTRPVPGRGTIINRADIIPLPRHDSCCSGEGTANDQRGEKRAGGCWPRKYRLRMMRNSWWSAPRWLWESARNGSSAWCTRN
jgi:hypothetical protein